MHRTFLGLGSNMGDRQRTMSKAMEEIGHRIGRVVAMSSLYETDPWGYKSENKYINAVVAVDTELSPRGLLAHTQAIERLLGRDSKTVGGAYHDRTMDIDILLYDDVTIDETDLKIPHPRMGERDFVMNPLKEVMAKLA